MQIVIDIPEKVKAKIDENINACDLDVYDCVMISVKNGTPLKVSADGTLTVTVEDATKIGRVLVQDDKHNGELFYADSN